MIRKTVIALSLASLFFYHLYAASAAELRIGVRECVGEHVAPMETFLLENEIVNTLVNTQGAVVVREGTIRKKLIALNLGECDSVACYKALCEQLNLEFLVRSSLMKDKERNYHLHLNVYQKSSGHEFSLETGATDFGTLKKNLIVVSKIIQSLNFEEAKATPIPQVAMEETTTVEVKPNIEMLNGLAQIEPRLKASKIALKNLEANIKRLQQRIIMIMDKYPALPERYQEYLESQEKDKNNENF